MLLILNSYGWCTPEMVGRIAVIHGMAGRATWIYTLLHDLRALGYVATMRNMNGTNGLVYAVSEFGLAYIRARRDDLVCDTNVLKNPGSMNHVLAVNQIMLRFRSEFRPRFWLTDFQVRADNMQLGTDGLAKDYDSAGELSLPDRSIQIGIEFESQQKTAAQYAKLCACFAAEKYLHLVIYFLGSPDLLSSIAPHLRSLGGLVCFVNYRDFITDGSAASAFYWYDDEVLTANLRDVMTHVSQRNTPVYLPQNQLELRLSA